MSSSRHTSLPTKIIPSVLDLVGNTSLVALDRIRPGPGRILAKAEFMQPGGSVKDRAARAILLAARADGRLALGAPVIEMTSGNMGAGLAVACAALGHPLLATMSAGNSPQRARMRPPHSVRGAEDDTVRPWCSGSEPDGGRVGSRGRSKSWPALKNYRAGGQEVDEARLFAQVGEKSL